MALYPFRFTPVYKDYLWGGRSLERLGRALPPGIVAESWEISAHPDGVSVICNGPLAGLTLPEVLEGNGEDVLGRDVDPVFREKFPLLVKLIDAQQPLSVQVHPDDHFARTYEGETYGKTEMWYIMAAEPEAEIICGLLPGVTADRFAAALAEGTLETCLYFRKVSVGDVILIPAGTVHGLGKGIVLAEIQQNSNVTYRVYDYRRKDGDGRERLLHIDKAMRVINFSPADPACFSHPEPEATAPGQAKAVVAKTPYFTVELMIGEGAWTECADGSRFILYTFIAGTANIDYDGGGLRVDIPESLLIPAALGEYTLKGSFKALKTYVS